MAFLWNLHFRKIPNDVLILFFGGLGKKNSFSLSQTKMHDFAFVKAYAKGAANFFLSAKITYIFVLTLKPVVRFSVFEKKLNLSGQTAQIFVSLLIC
jgi:hypothetical protein